MHRVATILFEKRVIFCGSLFNPLVASKVVVRRAMSVQSSGADDQPLETAKLVHRSNDFGPDDINVDWGAAAKVWDRIAVAKELPAFVVGDGRYGMTNLEQIQEIGEKGEFLSNSSMYNRHRTFAICVGYTGTAYEYGYQRQKYKDDEEPVTVEVSM